MGWTYLVYYNADESIWPSIQCSEALLQTLVSWTPSTLWCTAYRLLALTYIGYFSLVANARVVVRNRDHAETNQRTPVIP